MSRRTVVEEGKRFGRLTVLRRDGVRKYGNKTYPQWLCQCDCGNTTLVTDIALIYKGTQSCGCLIALVTSAVSRTHGRTKSPEYNSWRGMIERCNNPNNNHYHIYGAQGIKVCERWRTFANFLEDMGARPEGMTLDRYPLKDGNYEPGNCRWATPKQQNRNTSRTILIEWGGETLCRKDWAKRLGITEWALAYRIRNWDFEKAMTTYAQPNGVMARKLTDDQIEMLRCIKSQSKRFWNPQMFADLFDVTKCTIRKAANGAIPLLREIHGGEQDCDGDDCESPCEVDDVCSV